MATKPRSIFEEVGTAPKARVAAPRPGGIDGAGKGARRSIRNWLVAIFLMVALIIAVGGMTRLTDSGLSITEWAPISGAIPPLSEATWAAEFAAYQQSPEYLLQNAGMSLAEFKYIYWWEWGHRQLARTIGMVWAVGFVFFWATGRIPTGWTLRLFSIGALIGLQGTVGWLMVNSGLQGEQTDVQSYWLAAHLGMAFFTFGVTGWFILKLGRKEADLMVARRAAEPQLVRLSSVLIVAAFVQILLGALVAGIDAGRAFPTWPDIGGGFFPPDPFQLTPLWRNFFEDAGLVQFMHRTAGYLLVLLGFVVWLRARRSPNTVTRGAYGVMMAVMAAQVVLGIVTVVYAAPIPLAIAHQITAVVLWVTILRARFLAGYPVAQSIRGAKA